MNTRYQMNLNNYGKIEILDTYTWDWVGGEFDTTDEAIAFIERQGA